MMKVYTIEHGDYIAEVQIVKPEGERWVAGVSASKIVSRDPVEYRHVGGGRLTGETPEEALAAAKAWLARVAASDPESQ